MWHNFGQAFIAKGAKPTDQVLGRENRQWHQHPQIAGCALRSCVSMRFVSGWRERFEDGIQHQSQCVQARYKPLVYSEPAMCTIGSAGLLQCLQAIGDRPRQEPACAKNGRSVLWSNRKRPILLHSGCSCTYWACKGSDVRANDHAGVIVDRDLFVSELS